MVIEMAISFIKSSDDNKSFNLAKGFGMDVYEIEKLEEVDDKIQELVDKKYSTIMITNEVASFSQDIIKKYNKSEKIDIIIT